MYVEQPKEESETHRVLRGQSLPEGCREVREHDGAGLHIGQRCCATPFAALTSSQTPSSSEHRRGESGRASESAVVGTWQQISS